MRFSIVTIFPDLVGTFLGYGLIRNAIAAGHIEVDVVDLRDHAHDRHRSVDDVPYGGGGGMVMRPEPLYSAVEAAKQPGERTVLLSPQGRSLTHSRAEALSRLPGLVMICGRYEGVDERVRAGLVDEEISIGDYVTMGGEIPALVLLETVARQLPGVVGNRASVTEDSFFSGLLDFPQYTRPQEFRSMRVPDVLLSGNHEEIARWRHREALRQTLERRPDLLDAQNLSETDRRIIEEISGGGVSAQP